VRRLRERGARAWAPDAEERADAAGTGDSRSRRSSRRPWHAVVDWELPNRQESRRRRPAGILRQVAGASTRRPGSWIGASARVHGAGMV
jgi:hypothetical protein